MERNKDIFISYKNDDIGNLFAGKLSDKLKGLGYGVYYNPDEQHSGEFPERLRNAVNECTDFILILTSACLEQLMKYEKIDWIREELLTAYRGGKNIIPLIMPGVVMPKDKDDMPVELSFLPSSDGVKIYNSDFYDRSPLEILIKNWMKSKPNNYEKYKNTYQSNPEYNIDEEFKKLEYDAKNGDYNAMYELATFYMYHLGETDNNKAYYWYNKALKSKDEELKAHVYSRLAGMYFSGTIPGEEQSFKKAYLLREISAEYNGNAAMLNAAMSKIGSGCEFNYKAIKDNFEKLSTTDSITVKEQADFYRSYGEFDAAIELYKRIRDKMPEASYQLGLLYKLGVQSDPPMPDCFRAENCFRRAAKKGHIEAAYELGMLYYNPPLSDFEKDFEQAVEYFKKAADAGIAEAQYKLGWMYRYGLGCDINIGESIRYQEMAASQGHTGGRGQLAYLYQMDGFINYQKAFENAKLAADANYAQGAYMCGNFLFWGRGCEPDEAEALRYYKFAYQHGSYEAKLMINKIENSRAC